MGAGFYIMATFKDVNGIIPYHDPTNSRHMYQTSNIQPESESDYVYILNKKSKKTWNPDLAQKQS